MSRSNRLLAGWVVLAFLFVCAHAPTALGASIVTDPAGDYTTAPECGGQICEPWQDIIQAQITHVSGGLHFTMTLAASIPAAPSLPPDVKTIIWAWRLDTNPADFPKGYPLPNGVDSPFEVIVGLKWDGAQFTGVIIDRRPALTGGQATITPLTVTVSGNQLSADTGSLVSLPASFAWRASTNVFKGPEGSQGQYPVDNTAFAAFNPGD